MKHQGVYVLQKQHSVRKHLILKILRGYKFPGKFHFLLLTDRGQEASLGILYFKLYYIIF